MKTTACFHDYKSTTELNWINNELYLFGWTDVQNRKIYTHERVNENDSELSFSANLSHKSILYTHSEQLY